MKDLSLFTIAIVWLLCGISSGELMPLEKPYKLLVLIPVSPWSHRQIILPVVEALADRGHEVVVLSKYPPATSHPNIHELTIRNSIYERDMDFFEVRRHPLLFLANFRTELAAMTRRFYNDTMVTDLYNMRQEFDAVIFDALFTEAMFPFADGKPLITVSVIGVDYQQSAVIGNVLNPAYVPTKLWEFARPWKIYEKVFNIAFHFINAFFWRHWIVPAIQRQVQFHLPESKPLLDLERNQSLTFLNSHFGIDLPIPLLPSQVQIGAIHCRSPKPLSKELISWIEGAGDEGVAYVSLGSTTKGNSMPFQYRDIFVAAFAKISLRVIWKYEGLIPNISENVLVKKWFPQQDILANPKVKIFIFHGGLMSLQESLYHKTPVLTLPIFGDQERVAGHVHNKGFGRWLEWEALTVDHLLEAIQDVANNNSRYRENVQLASKLMREQPTSAKELSVFWTEYVIKHGGAPHLRSPAVDLSWAELFLIDAALFVAVVGWVAIVLVRVISRRSHLDQGKMKAE